MDEAEQLHRVTEQGKMLEAVKQLAVAVDHIAGGDDVVDDALREVVDQLGELKAYDHADSSGYGDSNWRALMRKHSD